MAERMQIKNRERLLRSFLGKTEESTFPKRFGIGAKGEFLGRRTQKGFLFYRRRIGVFNLFALTLWGSFSRDGGRDVLNFRFGRCRPVAVLWILWCLLMLFAGILLLGTSPLFALWFVIPSLLCALPLFLFSKREKARLIAFLESIEE